MYNADTEKFRFDAEFGKGFEGQRVFVTTMAEVFQSRHQGGKVVEEIAQDHYNLTPSTSAGKFTDAVTDSRRSLRLQIGQVVDHADDLSH